MSAQQAWRRRAGIHAARFTMKIAQLIEGLPVQLAHGSPAADITEIVEDSRQAVRGCLFVARPGVKTDGRQFINDAVEAGAAAVLTDDAAAVPSHVAALVTDDVARQAAVLAERFHSNPSSLLQLVGITGTNGKTTTAYLVRHLLNTAEMRCGLIGTVQIDDGARTYAASLTTPPAFEISRLLRLMADNGCNACAMEASSHALDQQRTAGLRFQIGVFTNLSGDHLDYHRTMEAYFAAKAMLFERLPHDGRAIINIDDPYGQHMAVRSSAPVVTCSVQDAEADCCARIGRQSLTSIEATFAGPWGSFDCELPLIGRHNVCNALQALAVAHVLGAPRDALERGIATCEAPPGRLEPVTTPEHGFAVLVDYAHTDDALDNVLRALKPIVPEGGRLCIVFGCGGDRDRTKRPRMARVACRYADAVILTSDNPRTEDPQAIVDEIRAGVPEDRAASTLCIVDRAEAIRAAIDRAQDGDIVLIAGKGHEDYQIIGTQKRPFDDRLVAAEALAQRNASAGVV